MRIFDLLHVGLSLSVEALPSVLTLLLPDRNPLISIYDLYRVGNQINKGLRLLLVKAPRYLGVHLKEVCYCEASIEKDLNVL